MSSIVTPIDTYLAAQADLRVVERFARTDVTGRTGQWSELIPLTEPEPGRHYRFEVDLDSCTGCKACVTACHSLNGLDEGESFRSIGLLVSAPSPAALPTPAQQTVTTTCHHCADPGCLTGCPAEAYEKDPVTGIVKHLDDACIGCQYCTLTCPYDVPLYNERLGIVRKCDMCSDRLGAGEAPACVQGCPTAAITVTTFETASLADPNPADRLVPGAAPSALTSPTTIYSGALLDRTEEAEALSPVKPQHGHTPLVVMLVLSQISVGVAIATALFGGGWSETTRAVSLLIAAIVGTVSALASFAHLGQPRKAWRVVLGWSHSWLSREALLLPTFLGVAALASASTFASFGGASILTIAAAFLGAATVASSALIYIVTGRRFWALGLTAIRFANTVAAGCFGWVAIVEAQRSESREIALAAACGVAAAVIAKLAAEHGVHTSTDPDIARSARLLAGPLAAVTRRRQLLAAGAIALFVLAALVNASTPATAIAIVALSVLTAAELHERHLFFTACAPATMPGAPR